LTNQLTLFYALSI